MLQGNFYNIKSIEVETGSGKASIGLNHEHEIFKGHFPETPVVPGVCMMQMVKEVLEDLLAKKTNLIRADHMKFLSVINPELTNSIEMQLQYTIADDGDVFTTASLFNDGVIYFKFKGILRPE